MFEPLSSNFCDVFFSSIIINFYLLGLIQISKPPSDQSDEVVIIKFTKNKNTPIGL